VTLCRGNPDLGPRLRGDDRFAVASPPAGGLPERVFQPVLPRFQAKAHETALAASCRWRGRGAWVSLSASSASRAALFQSGRSRSELREVANRLGARGAGVVEPFKGERRKPDRGKSPRRDERAAPAAPRRPSSAGRLRFGRHLLPRGEGNSAASFGRVSVCAQAPGEEEVRDLRGRQRSSASSASRAAE
jgi:hypothetical protein